MLLQKHPHPHREPKLNKTNDLHLNQTTQTRGMYTWKYKHCGKKRLMSESPAYLGWHLLGDTLLFAGQSCSVSKLQYHIHSGQRQPSCGVHSALETTSGFVCLEMRMWGGSETTSTQNQAQELFTHLTFTGVYAVFLSHCCSSIHIHFLSFQFGIG